MATTSERGVENIGNKIVASGIVGPVFLTIPRRFKTHRAVFLSAKMSNDNSPKITSVEHHEIPLSDLPSRCCFLPTALSRGHLIVSQHVIFWWYSHYKWRRLPNGIDYQRDSCIWRSQYLVSTLSLTYTRARYSLRGIFQSAKTSNANRPKNPSVEHHEIPLIEKGVWPHDYLQSSQRTSDVGQYLCKDTSKPFPFRQVPHSMMVCSKSEPELGGWSRFLWHLKECDVLFVVVFV